MANNQMLTSKKPSKGAKLFHPRDTKIARTVDSVTTHVSAKKTSSGKVEIKGDILIGDPAKYSSEFAKELAHPASKLHARRVRRRVPCPVRRPALCPKSRACLCSV